MVLGTFIDMSTQTFHKLSESYERFFKLLPEDWKAVIVPFWKDYEISASIYVFESNSEIIAGGIVFSTCPPDLLTYKNDLQHLFY